MVVSRKTVCSMYLGVIGRDVAGRCRTYVGTVQYVRNELSFYCIILFALLGGPRSLCSF